MFDFVAILPTILGIGALIFIATILIAYTTILIKATQVHTVGTVRKNGPFKGKQLPEDVYDCIIVGGGPSGSTMGYYVSKGGGKVAILEKRTFPRDKFCGDAVCTPAIEILKDMGIMDDFIQHNEAKFADAGGFVSPGGLSYIGASKEKLGEAACCAIKRIHLDTRMAHKARATGVSLIEDTTVVDAKFSKKDGLWSVETEGGKFYKARVLVCADGAHSKLATHLGYVTEAPKGVCSRAYVTAGTHNTNFDGVCFYQPESLPGYSAIFRHPNDELNYCYYLIPCGGGDKCGDVKESDLPRLHNDAISKDPFISKALGPNVKIERMKAAPLRLGGQGVKTTYDDHLLIIGDAAGHIDPLTGEGIHNAMMCGKAAGETMLEMMAEGDYTSVSTKVYEDRWMQLYGHDFYLSQKMAEALYKYPILLDACAAEMNRKGDAMMAKWAEIMTGMKPKSFFLWPQLAIPMGFAVLQELISRHILKHPRDYYKN